MRKTQFLSSMRFKSHGANDNPYHRKMMLLGFFKKDVQLVSPIKANDIPEDRSVTDAIRYTCGPSFHMEN